MAEFSAKPKAADVLTLSGSVCLMGAEGVLPMTYHIVSIILFWSGLTVLVGYSVYRWGLHYVDAAGLSFRLGFNRYVPLEAAAVWAYEQLEKSGLDKMVVTNYSSPTVPLTQCKYMLLYQCDDVEPIGIRPPSKKSRIITRAELRELHPSDDDSNLLPKYEKGPGFHNVCIKRRDMKRALAEYMALLRRNAVRREARA